MYKYNPQNVCSKAILFDVMDDNIKNVVFQGGCDGNSQGISRLVEGMPIDQVIEKLKGIRCGNKETSCPDQLAKALILFKTGK